MIALFYAAAALQGLLILLDEILFHRRRRLPLWERIGHPVDSISLLIPIGILLFATRTSFWEAAYVVTSVLSCLCITKDEWIHREHAIANENWLHAVLFILHPVVLISARDLHDASPTILAAYFVSVAVFTIYQIAYWNFYAARPDAS